MRLGINQPTFLPWLGFFELLNSCHRFVFLDNVQVVKQSFMVRNRILAHDGQPRWISVSLRKHRLETLIKDARLSDHGDWVKLIERRIASYYERAPFFRTHKERLFSILRTNDRTLADYNIFTTEELYSWIFNKPLDYVKASSLLSEYDSMAGPLDKVLQIIDTMGSVNEYLNSRSGVEGGLYPPEPFVERSIALLKQEYCAIPYRQRTPSFIPNMSVVDLLFNEPQDTWSSIIAQGSHWARIC